MPIAMSPMVRATELLSYHNNLRFVGCFVPSHEKPKPGGSNGRRTPPGSVGPGSWTRPEVRNGTKRSRVGIYFAVTYNPNTPPISSQKIYLNGGDEKTFHDAEVWSNLPQS